MKSLEFFFDGNSVGVFFQLPKTEGSYEFEPFRGTGHYQMATTIESQGFADCYFYYDDKKFYFKAEYEEKPTPSKRFEHTLKVTELVCFLI